MIQPLSILAAADAPAGGAALDQVAIATAGATIVTAVLMWLIIGHRRGNVSFLGRAAAFTERVSGLPGWAALPSLVATGALGVALLGMYWDIALHIDVGRDEGPLANPAHYLILIGLYGVFAAGILAIALPGRDVRPGPAPVRIAPGWFAPIGGLLVAACGGFALIAFPLDDVWHRLFGQDVTLWGPTHLMLIGGAGMTLVGQAVLLVEGMRSRTDIDRDPALIVRLRRLGIMGGFLIGLSTFQAEFDFGVPQYRLVFQPALIALAAGFALVSARVWIGAGGAIGAALFFLVLRGGVDLAVGDIFGQTQPDMPLYLGAALCVEAAALMIGDPRRRLLAFGALAGVLAGTIGFASEWAWTQIAMPLPWTADLLPEAPILAALCGLAGGLSGALLAGALRGTLPSPRVSRATALAALAAVAGTVAFALPTSERPGARTAIALTEAGRDADGGRQVHAAVTVTPAAVARDAAWVTVTAWQGGSLIVDRLERTVDGVFTTTRPIPVHGDWKTLVRVHAGDALLGAPLYLPRDTAIPAPEVPALAHVDRPLVHDQSILQREQKDGVPGWLTTLAPLVVLAIALSLLAALSLGLARLGRAGTTPPHQQRAPATRAAAAH